MSIYFIHAEVLDGGDIVTKVCATATASNASEAFDWFLGCELVFRLRIGCKIRNKRLRRYH